MITRKNFEIWFLDYAEGKLNQQQEKTLFEFLRHNPDLKKYLDDFEITKVNPDYEKPNLFHNLKKTESWLLNKYSIDELIFNFNEKLLSNEELKEFHDYLSKQPELQKEIDKQKSVILKPDFKIGFEYKSFLKKEIETIEVTQQNFNELVILFAEEKNTTLKKSIDKFIQANPNYKKELDLALSLKLQPDLNLVFENKSQLKQRETKVISIYWKYAVAAAAIIIMLLLVYKPHESKQDTIAETKTNTNNKHNVKNNTVLHNNSQNETNLANIKKQQSGVKTNVSNRQENEEIKKINNHELKEIKDDNLAIDKNIPLNKENEKILPHDTLKNDVKKEIEKDSYTENKTQYNIEQNKPLDFMASVINKSFYADKTPENELNNSFYAMRNVVNTVSSGNADIQRKESSDYKELKFNIGKFGFSRKKAKNNNDE